MRIGRITIDRQLLRLLWDLFMVWVAVINLSLILFDLTYLWVRPLYFKHLGVITRIYDPVLGIEPHPVTEELVRTAEDTAQLLDLDASSDELAVRLATLAVQTEVVLSEDVFDRSGQRRSQIVIAKILADETHVGGATVNRAQFIEDVSRTFWSGTPELLRHRFALFDSRVAPTLRENFFREYNRAGNLTDHFWIIDLPFLTLFWIEFAVRWSLALRRKTFARWFFFPIFNWYDLLGLIPLQEFRVFRLLRAVSMYMRLRRSELSSVGRDFATRTVEYISNIVTEEVSDRVAVRLLEEYAEEIRDGTHLHIIEATVGMRRSRIESVLAEHVGLLVTNQATLDSFRRLMTLNLSRAVETSESLRSVPLPKAVLAPLINTVGEVLVASTIETVTTTLQTPEGQAALEELSASIFDAVVHSPALEETTNLIEEISLHVIDHMKDTVQVKKWAMTDEEKERKRPELKAD